MFGGLSLVLSAMLVGVGGGGASASVRASGPSNITANSFTTNFSVMKQFKSLAAAGHGKIATILPDTVSSTRYVAYDAPDITKALQTAGVSSSNYVVQNALGSDATQLTDAQTDISNGATVLLVDPLDSGVGAQIESYAKSHSVKVIDYDRLTLGGSRAYYVSFNNVLVGKTMGQGLVSCISAWHVSKPQVVVMHGAATDNNATLFAQGYDGVLNPLFKNKQIHGGRTHRGHLGRAHSGKRVPSGVHGTHEHQRGACPQRHNQRSDRHLPAVTAREAQDVPDHWAGRLPGGPAERARGLPVRHGVQAEQHRGADLRRPGPVPASRREAAEGAGERHHEGHDGRMSTSRPWR